MMIPRRGMMATGLAAALTPSAVHASDWGKFTELQRGDPNLPRESITLDAEDIQKRLSTLASYRDRMTFPSLVKMSADAAGPMIGWSRTATPDKIASILDLYDLPLQQGGAYVPFCAAGVSFLMATAYVQFWKQEATLASLRGALQELDRYHFYPSPSVMDMYYVARGKRRWVDANPASTPPKPGWLVIYDWSGKQTGGDHVGLVTGFNPGGANTPGQINTIEFNTSPQNQKDGGTVAKRTRSYNNFVRGFIRTDIATPI